MGAGKSIAGLKRVNPEIECHDIHAEKTVTSFGPIEQGIEGDSQSLPFLLYKGNSL